ncbi:putative 1, 4-alpha-D-glucan glucohydrolase [Seiridium unicorne]|uniref:glucan 1,4-alpha-glucosidase n=1 Tax=Seiridium unicorne TaxID=138068 RepID=A0ABR2UIN4_9PEZI
MPSITSKLVAVIAALSSLGSASPARLSRAVDVDAFIAAERPIALQGALNNIGPNGSSAEGAAAGYVVASPSKVNPNYFYTWSRDSALTLKMIIDEFLLGDTSLQQYIEDYLHAQAVLQTVSNPSGTFLPSGKGLGEPKYNVDGTRFNGNWGRPQRDGPALRAIALITYSNWLVSVGQASRAQTVVWPIISNDLSYVGQYWNSTGFDLWEEVSGSSFFTIQNQYRALVEGTTLASTLGVDCTGCDEAPQVLCFLQSFWNGEYFIANINTNTIRTGLDANTILGSIAIFDVNATCDNATVQPCSSRGLSNFKAFVDSFRNGTLYPINDGVSTQSGIALGRYTEDVYYGGNPWYLITAGAAEYLYDAVAQWRTQGALTIDDTSLSFFTDIYPSARTTIYGAGSNCSEFLLILNAVSAYADSFVSVVEQYTPVNGSLSEQFNKTAPGNPISAYDLTWSYAAFVTMSERRAGQYPPSWESAAAAAVPSECLSSSTQGVYVPAFAAGAPNVSSSCTSYVQFAVNASTYFGENVYLVGNTSDLGAWDVNNAQPLLASNYTSERPLWYAPVALTAGEYINYGYARQEDCDQPWIFETVNRTLLVPACDESDVEAILAETNDAWTGPYDTRPGDDVQLAIKFEPEEGDPKLIWVSLSTIPVKPGMLILSLKKWGEDFRDHLGLEHGTVGVGLKFITYNPRTGLSLSRTLGLWCRDKYISDGSKERSSLITATKAQGQPEKPSRGPFLACALESQTGQPVDIHLEDFRQLISYYNHWESGKCSLPRKISMFALERLSGKTIPIDDTTDPSDYDTPFLNSIPLPGLYIHSRDRMVKDKSMALRPSILEEPIYFPRMRFCLAYLETPSGSMNYYATALMINLDSNDSKWGKVPDTWKENIGDVIAVRDDGIPILDYQLVEITALCAFTLDEIQPRVQAELKKGTEEAKMGVMKHINGENHLKYFARWDFYHLDVAVESELRHASPEQQRLLDSLLGHIESWI